MSDLIWLWFFLFLVLDILFAMVRVSLVYLRLPQLVGLKSDDFGAVERTIKLLERPELSATLRLVLVITHFILAGISCLILQQVLDLTLPLGPVILVWVALAVLILGLEFAFEGLVLRNVESWAVRVTPLAAVLDLIFRPVSWVLMRILGSPQALQRSLGSVTEDELKTWVEQGQPEGSLELGERKMIASIFHFSDTLCREIMVPRIDVFALDVNTSINQAIEAIIHSGHSRFPVFEDSIDNIIGLLYAKDMLRLDRENIQSVRSLLRQAYFVPEAKKVDELLREMQAQGIHMAVVVDEYGGMAGLVTLEDIVEEIVGEIRDEYDEKEELLFEQINPDEYLFQGRIDLDDFNEIVDTHLTKDIADTLGGFIYGQIGRVPVGGEEIEIENWHLTVEQVSGRRIRMVRARRVFAGQDNEEQKNDSER